MWRSILLVVPKLLVFLAVLVIGYLVARLLRTAVAKGLRKAGFDRAVSRGPGARLFREGQIGAGDLCAKIVFYGVLLLAMQLAFGIWGPNPVGDLLTRLIEWLPRIFVAIVIIVVVSAIAGAVHDLIASVLGGLAYGRLLARAASVVIVTLGVIASLDQVQIATSVTQPLLVAVLATVAGVLIVGVGGGLIKPMQERWQVWLDRAETETAAIREHARAYAANQDQDTIAVRDEPATADGDDEGSGVSAVHGGPDRDVRDSVASRPGVGESEAEETQVIPIRPRPRPRPDESTTVAIPAAVPSDDSVTVAIPAAVRPDESSVSSESESEDDVGGATVIANDAADTTVINPGRDETVVIGSGTEAEPEPGPESSPESGPEDRPEPGSESGPESGSREDDR